MLFGPLLFKYIKVNLIIGWVILSVLGFLMLFPSFRGDIRNAVYDSLIRIATPILAAHLAQIKIPDQIGTTSIPFGFISYGVTNISLTEVKLQNSYASVGNDGVTLSFCNASIGGHLDWYFHLENTTLQSEGKADADFLEVNMVAGLNLISTNGTLELNYTHCKFEIEKLIIKFRSSVLSPLLNAFRHTISEILKDYLNTKTCDQIKEAITKNANTKLKNIPLGTGIGEAVKIFLELFSDTEVGQPPVSCRIPNANSDKPQQRGCKTTSITNNAVEAIECKKGDPGCTKRKIRPHAYF